MKILYICQYFYPEVFRGNDIAFHWAEIGHDVHVVCGVPNYPYGKFYDGYGILKRRHDVVNGVKVTRLPIIPRGKSKITLMLNYFSFLVVSWVFILIHSLFHKYDRVFVQQLSPVMMSAPGVLYKRIRKVPLYTWVLDLWPESLTVAGGVENKFILSFFRHYVENQYRHSDIILISSRSFEKSVLSYGDYKGKIVYFPQWSDTATSSRGRSKIGDVLLPEIPSGFKLMFAGAIGEAHGFDCTMRAALLTKDKKDIKWIIVGDGRKLDWVKNYVKEHGLEETVYTLGSYPVDTMPWFFKQADVMLVTLSDNPLYRLYAPAKISSYMAAEKPIIAVLSGEGADVIREADCGWTIDPGDAEGFAELAVKLSQIGGKLLEEKGHNASVYYREHYLIDKCLKRLDEIMDIS